MRVQERGGEREDAWDEQENMAVLSLSKPRNRRTSYLHNNTMQYFSTSQDWCSHTPPSPRSELTPHQLALYIFRPPRHTRTPGCFPSLSLSRETHFVFPHQAYAQWGRSSFVVWPLFLLYSGTFLSGMGYRRFCQRTRTGSRWRWRLRRSPLASEAFWGP